MKFRPLHDRVVVKRIDAEEKTAGGIIIPDTAQEKPSQGEIVAIGPGGRDEAGKLIPIDLKVGDTVLGLNLAHGGHLTHGMKLNISGQLYNFISYGEE